MVVISRRGVRDGGVLIVAGCRLPITSGVGLHGLHARRVVGTHNDASGSYSEICREFEFLDGGVQHFAVVALEDARGEFLD
jgi:hypothetical protein